MKFKLSYILCWFCVLCNSAFAEEVQIEYQNPTEVTLSNRHVNRIHFANSKLKKIVGNNNKYNLLLSDNHKDLFISFNSKQEEIVNVSIIDVLGKVYDLKLKLAEKKDPVLVTITNNKKNQEKIARHQEEIDGLIRAMSKGMTSKYYVIKSNKILPCSSLGEFAKCKLVSDYRFGKYRGVGLEVSNEILKNRKGKGKGKGCFIKGNKDASQKLGQNIILNQAKIEELLDADILSMNIDNVSLEAGNKTIIYMVMLGGDK